MNLLSRCTAFLLSPLLVSGPLLGQQHSAAETLQLRVVDSDGPQVTPGAHSVKGFAIEATDATSVPVADVAVVFRLPDSAATGTFSDGSHSAVAYTDASGVARISGIQWSSTPGAISIRITGTRGSAHAGILVDETLASASMASAVAAPGVTPPLPTAVAPPESVVTALAPPALVAPRVEILNDVEPSPRSTKPSIAPIIRESGSEPAISITNDAHGTVSHGSRKKWLIIAGIAAGAGAGAFLAMHSHSSTAAPASTTSIGAPTINIGH